LRKFLGLTDQEEIAETLRKTKEIGGSSKKVLESEKNHTTNFLFLGMKFPGGNSREAS